MRAVSIAITVGVLLGGCASAGSDAGLTTASLSEGSRQKDSEACWNFVLNTQEGRTKADVARVSGSILGGVTSTSITSREASDRRSDPANRSAHASCMRKRGHSEAS